MWLWYVARFWMVIFIVLALAAIAHNTTDAAVCLAMVFITFALGEVMYYLQRIAKILEEKNEKH